MELQFHKYPFACMQRPLRQVQEQEQTQELRLTDQMPDVGKVLCSWGQVLIRGKEWNSDSMQLAGGVMVWVLYQPEDGSAPKQLEGWIPFQMRWDFPQSQRDGIMRICPLLRSIDARAISARKLMVRCNLSVCAEGYVQDEVICYKPDEIDADVQILQNEYPIMLSVEAGEKPFALEEELTLPSACEKLQKVVCYWVRPELIDKKVMGDKAVFRGSIGVHLLYCGADDRLHTWDFDVPFSQYTELDRTYAQEADISLWLAPTSLELDVTDDGKLLLKAGMTGQYVIYDRTMLSVTEDAYSTRRHVEVQREQLSLPALLESTSRTLPVTQNVGGDGDFVDAVVLTAQPHMMRLEDGVEARLEYNVQVLYYDEEGQLQSTFKRWDDMMQIPCAQEASVDMHVHLTGKPQVRTGADGIGVTVEMLMDTNTVSQQIISAVTGLKMGEEIAPDPARPSMILRRMGADGLWQMAKESGSTMEAIRTANNLTDQPEMGRLILIPVL